MTIRRFRMYAIAFIVLAGLPFRMSFVARAMSGKDDLALVTRSRAPLPEDASRFRVVQKKVEWNPKQTAIIICDVWDQHWCEGATRRGAELAPHINDLACKARDMGMLIIHAPSGTMDSYENHPGRKIARSAPKAANLPEDIAKWCRWIDDKEEAVGYPIDHSDGGCDCTPQCKQGNPWRGQIAAIEIGDKDAISDSGVEIWNLLEQRGIKNVILMGVHTNMCVLGRPFGLRNMARSSIDWWVTPSGPASTPTWLAAILTGRFGYAMELRTCSRARMLAKTAYVVTIGVIPDSARPAAIPNMFCSATPH